MDRDENIAPLLRYVATGVVLLVSVPLLLVMKESPTGGSPFALIFCMALVGIIAIGLIVGLNNDYAKSKVVKLPKKRDTFIS